jgi:hypothetical protein
MKILNYFLVIIILAFYSCSPANEPIVEPLIVPPIENDTIHQKGTKIFPLAVGNKWEYVEREYHDSTLVFTKKIVTDVLKRTSIASGQGYKEVFELKEAIIYEDGTEGSFMNFYLQEVNETIMLYGFLIDGGNINLKDEIYLKYPIEAGESWTTDQGDYINEYHCISTNEQIVIGDSTYECLVIRTGYISGEPWYVDYYYSKGIGLIQIKSYLKQVDFTRRINTILKNNILF